MSSTKKKKKLTRQPTNPRGKRSQPTGKVREPKVMDLLRRSLSTYFRLLPAIAVVTIAGQLPIQLVLAWIFQSQGITSTMWHMQFQGAADWVFGSLVVSALYVAIFALIREEAPKSLLHLVLWAYRKGLRAWLGMFLTRMMVSFIVGVAGLPALCGILAIINLWPGLGSSLTSIEQLGQVSMIQLAPLLLAAPLLALPVAIYLRYALAEAVVAIEGIDGFGALERSRTLTYGSRWLLLLCLVPLEVPIQTLSYLVLGSSSELNPFIMALIYTAMMVLGVLLGTLLVHFYIAQGGEGSPPDVQDDGAAS